MMKRVDSICPMVRKWMLGVIAALGFVVAGCQPPDRPSMKSTESAASSEAYPVKPFSAPLLSNPEHQVSLDDYKGKVVLLDFWATWCPPCRHELPTLNKLYEEYAARGFEVVGMTVDQGEPNAIARSVEKLGVRYPAVLAGPDAQQAFGGIRVVPTKFLLDRQGAIRKFYQGVVPERVLRNDIESLLAM